MSLRLTVVKVLMWAYLVVDASMVTLGIAYAIGLWTNNTFILTLVESDAFSLALIFITIAIISLVIGIPARIVYAAILNRRPVSMELKDRLQKLGVDTLTTMKIDRPIGLSVARNNYAAFARRDRIFVGDKLLQTAPDERIIGSIAHEMGHILTKHVFLTKQLMFYLRAIAFLAVLLVGITTEAGTILGVTALVAFALARIPLNWRPEYTADENAARRLGLSPMLSWLEKLRETEYDGISFTHPPLSRRIRRLQSMALSSQASPV